MANVVKYISKHGNSVTRIYKMYERNFAVTARRPTTTQNFILNKKSSDSSFPEGNHSRRSLRCHFSLSIKNSLTQLGVVWVARLTIRWVDLLSARRHNTLTVNTQRALSVITFSYITITMSLAACVTRMPFTDYHPNSFFKATRFLFLVSSLLFRFWRHALDWAGHPVSIWAHVLCRMSYRIISHDDVIIPWFGLEAFGAQQ